MSGMNLPASAPVGLAVVGIPLDQTFAPTSNVGVVVIGRNEGQRLVRCLESVRGQASCVVYVDSGSTDGSVSTARSLADAIVELDMDRPFTAARARNEGFERLLKTQDGLRYVFFVDGDCEVVEGWLATAVKFLTEHPDFAVRVGNAARPARWQNSVSSKYRKKFSSRQPTAANTVGRIIIDAPEIQSIGWATEFIVLATVHRERQRLMIPDLNAVLDFTNRWTSSGKIIRWERPSLRRRCRSAGGCHIAGKRIPGRPHLR